VQKRFFNKWLVIGAICVIAAMFAMSGGAWLKAAILTSLGVVNLAIGFHLPEGTERPARTEQPSDTATRVPEWVRNVATGLVIFVVMALLLLLLFGDVLVATVMAAAVMGPITILGAIAPYRRARAQRAGGESPGSSRP
jgi:membrane protein implicated in regulation of membrane protease activity